MTLSILGWLIGTKTGRYIALGALISLSVVIVLARVYAAGQAKERARQIEASLRNLRERIKVDDEITSLSVAERGRRLGRWLSD